MAAQPFAIELLFHTLKDLPESSCYRVAYSGGLDSHVLLHALSALSNKIPQQLAAVHVNHGLNDKRFEWAEHCSKICDELGVPCQFVEIDAGSPDGQSPESWARQLRYQALAAQLQQGEILLTAHHKDDQAETLLLQLLRGAGPDGLSAMPALRRFGAAWHARPLLQYNRQQLMDYAEQQGLHWVDDDSNRDKRFDRNYLRHKIMPLLDQRWGNISDTLARAASHQAESAELQKQLASIDIESCLLVKFNALNIIKLGELSDARKKNVIRYWLQEMQLSVPDARKMQHILVDVLQSKQDAVACVSWPGVEIRRYKDKLFASTPLCDHDSRQIVRWQLDEVCRISHGELTACLAKGQGIKKSLCPDNCIEVRYRSGGETIKPVGRRHQHDLKKLFQETGIPPWFRYRIPLLFIKGRLAAVPGFWIDEQFSADVNEDAWQISWSGVDEIVIVD